VREDRRYREQRRDDQRDEREPPEPIGGHGIVTVIESLGRGMQRPARNLETSSSS
jgi:hypothetical protein